MASTAEPTLEQILDEMLAAADKSKVHALNQLHHFIKGPGDREEALKKLRTAAGTSRFSAITESILAMTHVISSHNKASPTYQVPLKRGMYINGAVAAPHAYQEVIVDRSPTPLNQAGVVDWYNGDLYLHVPADYMSPGQSSMYKDALPIEEEPVDYTVAWYYDTDEEAVTEILDHCTQMGKCSVDVIPDALKPYVNPSLFEQEGRHYKRKPKTTVVALSSSDAVDAAEGYALTCDEAKRPKQGLPGVNLQNVITSDTQLGMHLKMEHRCTKATVVAAQLGITTIPKWRPKSHVYMESCASVSISDLVKEIKSGVELYSPNHTNEQLARADILACVLSRRSLYVCDGLNLYRKS